MNDDAIIIDLSDLDLSTYSYSSDYTITLDSGSASAADITTFDIGADWLEDQEIVNTEREERAIRERNEGVQKAWEQYKIMVELAKNPPENL